MLFVKAFFLECFHFWNFLNKNDRKKQRYFALLYQKQWLQYNVNKEKNTITKNFILNIIFFAELLLNLCLLVNRVNSNIKL